MTYTQDHVYLSVSTPLGKDKLLLKGFHGEENLSGLFHYTLEMVSEDNNLDFSTIVGKSATIAMQLANGQTRYVNGIVGRFYQAGTAARFTTYYADLHPWLWLLTLTADSQIFQAKTAPQIIEAVFSNLGFTDYKDSLTKTYAPRDYCVQYQETAFNFVSRLMEDEGIFYYFAHADGQHTLVLADDASAYATCPGLSGSVRYTSSLEGSTVGDAITYCTFEQQVRTGKYGLGDYNFETPSTDLTSTVEGSSGNLQVYEYPGGYDKKDAGDARATLRLQSLQWPQTLLRGEGFSPAFSTGYTFTLEGHDRSAANTTYVLTRVSHSATVENYTNSFEAFPSSTPYRPPRQARKPVIPGTQTALVVGKSGEEIWTDKYGRVKVQFYWDRLGSKDENSSCWIRVAQGWAGKSWGSIFIPRIGQEVIVSFLEGDPDRPLITGAVYNADQVVPYTLPDDGTKSTVKSSSSKGGNGFNEIRFEDKADSEEIFIQAQKDLTLSVLNNDTETIKQNRTTTIQEGNESLSVEQGNRTVEVKTGNETHKVQGTRDLTVTGNETHTNQANFDQKVTGNFTLKVTGDLTIDVVGAITIKSAQSVTTNAAQNLNNKAGMSLANEAGQSLSNKAGMSLTNEAGVSLTNKGGATQSVEAGGILSVKGAMVNINS